MSSEDSNLPESTGNEGAVADPIADPGLPEHEYRPTDVDAAAEKRAERQVASLFVFSMICAVLFVVAYFTVETASRDYTSPSGWDNSRDLFMGLGASNVFLGLTLAGALFGIGIGVIQWARKLMSDHEITEMRHSAASPEEDRKDAIAAVMQGGEDSGIGRRPLVRNTLLGSLAMLGLPAVVALRDLAPKGALDIDKLYHTVWREGMRIAVDISDRELKPQDIALGALVNANPAQYLREDAEQIELNGAEGHELHGTEKLGQMAKAAVILVRMSPEEIKPGKGRDDWSVEGIVCYSKICTHVGCPIALYEQQTHHLLCPCHQSTFDLADSGRVVFGPAARALPQLPITVDSEGYLVAQSDFTEPVGPSFWERG